MKLRSHLLIRLANTLLCWFSTALLSNSASGAEWARWEAAQPGHARGIHVAPDQASRCRSEKEVGGTVLRLTPSEDFYSRAAYQIIFDGSREAKGWLIIEFLDRGYGLIAVSPAVPQTRQWGISRVNSGRIRRAAFRYDKIPPSGLRIEGLDFLRAIMLTDDEPPFEPVPLVEPAIKFSVPSQRVTSAGGDSAGPDRVGEVLAGLRNQLPLVRAIGFNGVESYVRWGFVEREQGVYDWSFYDAIVGEIERHGLKWFPLLLAGSGYALPTWLHDSTNNIGFKCLEHGIVHDTQTIFHPFQTEYASRFLAEFGKHYARRPALLGVRLGPSGDYGEAQYPAKGPGYGFREGHTHIGYWAADEYAQADFRRYLKKKYNDVSMLNQAWTGTYPSFEQVKTFLPQTAVNPRMRLDFADWYMGAMSDWCEKWAIWSREALPDSVIHQSSGGWGPVPIGTDYNRQARSMARVHGGMRLTNEGDDFPDNFTITRMAVSAARFYDIALGFEPGGFGSKRGVMARLFNTVTTGGVHLFYYLGNLTGNDQALDAWLKYSPLLDQRARPSIDVAAFYPDTALKLDDEVLRYRWASTFFTVGRSLRERLDFDYASEQMILDGALERYKVLVFLWGAVMEAPVLEKIDRWVHNGGTVIYAPSPRGHPITVEGDTTISERWRKKETGRGRVVLWHGDLIPSQAYASFVRRNVLEQPGIRPEIRAALQIEKPASVFWSVLENGKLALLNFDSQSAIARLPGGKRVKIPAYEMAVEACPSRP